MVYNLTYLDGENGYNYVKRFQVLAITRDKEYDLTRGAKGSKITYFSANLNGEAETITVQLSQGCTAKIKVFDYNFADIEIKGRTSQGNILTKYPVRKIAFKSAGVSTLGGLSIWYDETIGRLNTDNRGRLLGNFDGSDSILVLRKDGHYEITTFDLTNRYEHEQLFWIGKLNREAPVTALYLEGESKMHYVKRFLVDTLTVGKRFLLIPETKGSQLLLATADPDPVFELKLRRDKKAPEETMRVVAQEQTEVKGRTALGSKLAVGITVSAKWLEPLKRSVESDKPEQRASEIETEVDSEAAGGRPEKPPHNTDLKLF